MSDVVDELALVRRYYGDPLDVDERARERARARLAAKCTRRPRAMGRAAAVAAAIVLTLIAGEALMPGQRASAAARALHRFALLADDRPLIAGIGEVVYERSELSQLRTVTMLEGTETFRYTVILRVEIWRAQDGSVLIRERILETSFVDPEDRTTWERLGQPPIPAPGDVIETRPPEGDVPLPVLGGLPSDPEALLEAIRDRWVPYVPATDEQLLLAVSELLARGDADPQLRADLFRAAAEIAGIELLGTVEDPLGRDGVGLRLGPHERRVTLVVDPETSFLLSVRETRSSGGSTTFDQTHSYTAWATVPQLGDQPDGLPA